MLKSLEKEMSKVMYFGVFYVFRLTFGGLEMNSYQIVTVFSVSELVKTRKIIA